MIPFVFDIGHSFSMQEAEVENADCTRVAAMIRKLYKIIFHRAVLRLAAHKGRCYNEWAA